MIEIYKMPVTTIIIYIVAFGISVAYIYYKWKKRQLFTIANFTVYFSFFSCFIISLFQFSDIAWYALGYKSAAQFYPYLFESMSINLIGLSIFLISDIYFESKKIETYFGRYIDKAISKYIIFDVVRMIFIFVSIIYVFIVFSKIGNFPIFSGNRNFYTKSGTLSFVYNGIIEMINIIALYFGIHWIKSRKHLILFVCASLLSLSTGVRSAALTLVLYPFVLVLAYKKNKKVKLGKMIVLLLTLLIFAVFIGQFREKSYNGIDFVTEILYGNNFSDIRDGAYLFYGYEANYSSEALLGKTYLSGIFSFVPSSIFKFRQTWSYGKFTTKVLFNNRWENHLGFRGGPSFEMYVNFRMIGVIILSIIRGYFMAQSEKSFDLNIYRKVKNSEPIVDNSVFFATLLSSLSSAFECSLGFRSIYVILIIFFLSILAYTFLPLKIKDNSF